MRTEICELCQNRCKITFAEIEGERDQPSWGYMCGRDPHDMKMRVHREFTPFRKRLSMMFGPAGEEKKDGARDAKFTLGIPRSLSTVR